MRKNYTPKPLFVERMKSLLGKDFEIYWESVKKPEVKSIRANTIKISVQELKKMLEEKKWVVKQPFKTNPEIFVIDGKYADENSDNVDEKIGTLNGKLKEKSDIKNIHAENRAGHRFGATSIMRAESERKIIDLSPGELGRSLEHLLGYYYVQEISSMLPVMVLKPKPDEIVLDLCASPGSKTSQMASEMKNTGTIIANDVKLGRIKILASNLERCGVANTIITKTDGIALCKRLKKAGVLMDKILVDAPCSGEGTIKSTPKTLLMWSINSVYALSKIQKNLLSSAIEILKPRGEIVYSTCTHAPEENEEVLDFVLKEFGDKIKIEKINLPVKCSPGVLGWAGGSYNKNVENSCRIYPHLSNTEGFFIAKLRKIK